MQNVSTSQIKKYKNQKKITMITAYDALFSQLFAPYAEIILVGDSLNMSFNGASDTLSLQLNQIIYHTKAVCKGVELAHQKNPSLKSPLIVCDLPFGSYMTNKQALKSSLKVYKQTSAGAIKIEGGIERADMVATLCTNGIAVMGHIGLKPQMVRLEGGYKIKREQEEQKLLKDAKALEDAGVFAIVLEGCTLSSASFIAKNTQVPIIGIGSGNGVDGQVLVWSDMLGFFEEFTPKFVRKYLDGATIVKEALKKYQQDVQSGSFPNENESYMD